MRVLFLDQYSDLGGAQQCLLDLLPALAGSGWQASLCLPSAGPMAERAHQMGVDTVLAPLGAYSSGHKSWSEIIRFACDSIRLSQAIEKQVRRFQPHLLYANGPRVLPAAARAARRKRVPLIFHCHNRLSQPASVWLARRSLRGGRAHLISCCRYAAEPLMSCVEPERRHIVFNGVAGPLKPLPHRRGSDGYRIGVLGRIAPEKGQAEFLRAARLILQEIPESRFVICGKPLFGDAVAERYLRNLEKQSIGMPVEFTGWQDDIDPLLRSLEVVVVPSIREPATPRVILEAYARGIPVVAFASGGIPEIVVDGETGLLVHALQAEALATSLVTLLKGGPQRLETLGTQGRGEWERRFTVERYQREIIALMGTATAAPGSGEQ